MCRNEKCCSYHQGPIRNFICKNGCCKMQKAKVRLMSYHAGTVI
uniref:Uncharacterized protein n=1 Tax=Rhizophora mucronata TaxID=61149 RepID=A0A2P2QCN2_RHIMU